MKNLLYILFLLPAFVFTSCLKEDDNVFGESAANRESATIAEVEETLCSAANGWIMEYYPESNQSFGGYSILMKFGAADSVIMTSELFPSETVSSLYAVKAEQGVLLTFDTYNKVLHYFSDPSCPLGVGKTGDGAEGDYEFFYISKSEEEIVFKGKKSGCKIVMKPLSTDIAWNEYIAGVLNEKEAFSFTKYIIKSENDSIGIVNVGLNRQISISIADTTYSTAYLCSSVGVKLYTEVEIDNNSVSEFIYNGNASNPLFLAKGKDYITLVPIPVPINEIFAESTSDWYMNPAYMSAACKENTWSYGVDNTYDGEIMNVMCLSGTYVSSASVKTEGHAMYIRSYDGSTNYPAYYGMNFTAVEGTEDQISFSSNGILGWNATYYPFVSRVIAYLNSQSPFVMTANSVSRPTEITFTSEKDPNVWFKVSTTLYSSLND